MKLLFTNAGRRTYLIEYALELRHSFGFELEIFVSDASMHTAAMHVSREVKSFITPRVSENPERYAEFLLAECRVRNIDVVIPLMDYELPALARWMSRFKDHGINVIVSSVDVVETTLDKQRCYKFCEENRLPIPRTWYAGENTSDASVPLIMKPRFGSGSVGLVRITKSETVPDTVPEDQVLQECVAGDEYGMDVLNGLDTNFLHCAVRKKIEMRAGETDKAELVYDDRLFDLGMTVSRSFNHVGNMDVDFIIDRRGSIQFLDFNPRFGGGYPFTHEAGFNYLEALLVQYNNIPVVLKPYGRKLFGAKGIKLFTFESGK